MTSLFQQVFYRRQCFRVRFPALWYQPGAFPGYLLISMRENQFADALPQVVAAACVYFSYRLTCGFSEDVDRRQDLVG